MIYPEKTLRCQDCNHAFLFTSAEQEFYAKKDIVAEPTRCPDCRSTRKGAGLGGQQQTFTAVCVQCGRETQLPSQPRGDRPVYCPDCVQQEQGGNSGYRRHRGGRHS